jgi:hypothetical protein
MARTRLIYTVAPVATEGSVHFDEGDRPRVPPAPLPTAVEPPVFRPLKVYAFDPSLGHTPGGVMTIPVRYEKLQPGPVGDRVAVIDYDRSRKCFYDPVDLDDPLIIMRGGLDPSESDPHFHQQMAYAVTCETLRRSEAALGRIVCRRTAGDVAPLRLFVYPHAMNEANAYASVVDGSMFLGYFRAGENATGRTVPGQTVFSCLSHDVLVHTTMHAVVMGIRPDLIPGVSDLADDPDLPAFHEGFCDTAALLLHFSYREAVLDTIQRTAGSIHRTLLEADGSAAADGARIQAEVVAGNPLLAMGQGFGEAMGKTGGLRNAIGKKPDPTDLQRLQEPHERGGILVAALMDAFFSIYLRRSLDLFRIYRAGGARLDDGHLPAPLAERLYAEVNAIAARIFNTCIRALDYCPACTMTLGDFLRACITADYEYDPADDLAVRPALMQAFQWRGIKPASAHFYSEEALRWPLVDSRTLKAAGPAFIGMPEPDRSSQQQNERALRAFVEKNAHALGLRPRIPVELQPLEVTRLAAADRDLRVVMSTTAVQRKKRAKESEGAPSGVRLIFDRTGKLRYVIAAGASA